MSNRPTIYTVGDSHAWHAWLKVPDVITGTVGPMLMYSFGCDKSILTNFIPLDAILCFCWGEIDCRCHVHKYQPWQQTIDSLVKKYLEVVDLNVVGRDSKLVWIYNVVPPVYNAIESPTFPFLGTIEERVRYVKYMNNKLRGTKYTFVDIYDACSTSGGFMKPEDSDGHVHLENEKYINEWIENNVVS